MILMTHDIGIIAEVADRVLVMYAGKIVETAGVPPPLGAPPPPPPPRGAPGQPAPARHAGRRPALDSRPAAQPQSPAVRVRVPPPVHAVRRAGAVPHRAARPDRRRPPPRRGLPFLYGTAGSRAARRGRGAGGRRGRGVLAMTTTPDRQPSPATDQASPETGQELLRVEGLTMDF